MGKRKINNKYRGVKIASKSSVEIAFTYNGKRCRERIQCIPSDSNLRKLADFRNQILESIENGKFDYASSFPNSKSTFSTPHKPYTVKDALIEWFKINENSFRISTRKDFRNTIYNQLLPELGDIALNELKREHIKDFIKYKTDKDYITKRRLNNIISPLRCALDYAEELNKLDLDPMSGWSISYKHYRIKPSQKSKAIKPFSFEERNAILNSLSGQNKNLVRFIMWTGLRTSEFIALNWSDINWNKKTVTIDKALTEAASEPEEPKTEAGIRVVKLLPEALEALKEQKKYTWDKGEEIFQNPKKCERWTGDQAVRKSMWKPALQKAGIEYRYPYQTRHTYASMMLTYGEKIHWVSRQMGHTDWAFTARTYARYIEVDDDEAGTIAAKAHEKREASAKRRSRHDVELEIL